MKTIKTVRVKVMYIAHHIRKINRRAWFNSRQLRFTFSECLRLAWKLIKDWSGEAGEIVRESIEIMRPNGAGCLRSKGMCGLRYTIS